MRTYDRGRRWLAVAAVGAMVTSLLTAVGSAPASAADTSFLFAGTTQTYTVPEGVTALRVTAVGASGGGGALGSSGGRGASVQATISVEPFQTLYVNVGGQGASGSAGGQGGFNGNGSAATSGSRGGGGGGATDIRTGFDSADRLLVAGGGGGGGGGAAGGNGGTSGLTAAAGSGGTTPGTAGQPGTVFHPGASVINGGAAGDTSPSIGAGGAGGNSGTSATAGGGGGGGGYHGGGGGGSDQTGTTGGGGGGGAGSSFAPTNLPSAPPPVIAAAATTGDGSVTIEAIKITTTSLPAATVGVAYEASLTTDASGPVSWSVSPELWTGLELTNGGTIQGTIPVLPVQAARDFVFTVTNPDGVSTSKTMTLTVGGAVPIAPTNVVASVLSATSASVGFSAPASDGGQPVLRYVVRSAPAGIVCELDATAPPLQCVFDGAGGNGHSSTALTSGVAYSFTVTAINAVGESAQSAASVPVTPGSVPTAPTNVVATVLSATTAGVGFSAPASDGGEPILRYVVRSTPAGIVCELDATAPPLQCVFDGAGGNGHSSTALTSGVAYSFTVTAINAVGESAQSAASVPVTPGSAPSAPTNVVATVLSSTTASVNFSAPASNGGEPVLRYVVSSAPAGIVCELAAAAPPLACVFDGAGGNGHSSTALMSGVAYTFTVTAINVIGESAPSATSVPITPGSLPDAPTDLTATRGNGTAGLMWDAPAGNGSQVVGYRVRKSTDSGATWSTVRSNTGSVVTELEVRALTNGVDYVFQVAALNSYGLGPYSDSSQSVTPATVPDPPTNLVVIGMGQNSAMVSFAAPIWDGGEPITGYTVTASPGARTCTTTTTYCIVAGLAGQTSYEFTVVAHNEVGSSAPSQGERPAGDSDPGKLTAIAPSPVTGLAISAGAKSTTVTWYQPVSDGGSPVSSYVVYRDGQTACVVSPLAGMHTCISRKTGPARWSVVARNSAAVSSPVVRNVDVSISVKKSKKVRVINGKTLNKSQRVKVYISDGKRRWARTAKSDGRSTFRVSIKSKRPVTVWAVSGSYSTSKRTK